MKKIVYMGDFHFPFQSTEKVLEAVRITQGHDLLIVGGDVFDCYSVSSYAKSKGVALETEYQIAQAFFSQAKDFYRKLVFIQGNHDSRPERNFFSQIPHEARSFLSTNLLRRLIQGDVFEKGQWRNDPSKAITNGELALFDNGAVAWNVKVGRTLVAHTEKWRKGQNQVAFDTYQHFLPQHRDLDCVIVGHVHRLNASFLPDVVLAEGGCLCEQMDYSTNDPKLRYGGQTNGIVTFVQKQDGSLIRESFRLHPL